MKWAFEKKMGFAFLLIIFAIIATISFTIRNNNHYRNNTSWIMHTHEVLNKSTDVFLTLKNIQTNQLDYILTGDSNFLRTYRSSKDSLFAYIKQLKNLTADNASQQIRIDKLQIVVDHIFNLYNTDVDQNNSLILNKDLLRKELFFISEINELNTQVSLEEKRLLNLRQEKRDQSIANSNKGSYLLIGSVILLIIIIYFSSRHNKRTQSDFGHKEKTFENRLQQQIDIQNNADQAFVKELAQYHYVISHDLKEPLRMITSFMHLLQKEYSTQLDNKANTYINFAIDGGKRMQKMIVDMLKYSRAGQTFTNRETVDFCILVQEVEMNLYKQIEEQGTQIIIDTPACLISVHKGEILRLLQNLISNAIKFSKTNITPVIHISCTEEISEWVISVQDNGIGIAAQHHEKIFEVFSRLHLSTEYDGTGVGLAICKKIAEQHKGKIWVESSPERGSTFIFTISKSFD